MPKSDTPADNRKARPDAGDAFVDDDPLTHRAAPPAAEGAVSVDPKDGTFTYKPSLGSE